MAVVLPSQAVIRQSFSTAGSRRSLGANLRGRDQGLDEGGGAAAVAVAEFLHGFDDEGAVQSFFSRSITACATRFPSNRPSRPEME